MGSRSSIVLALAIALGSCPAAVASHATTVGPHTVTARSGNWLVQFRYTQHTNAGPSYSKLHLRLLHGGTVALDMPVTSAQGNIGLEPAGGKSPVSFHDLNGDGSPELILDLYTGGAHCCYLSQIFNLADSPPRKLEHEWGDPGYVTTRIDGRTLLRSNDDRFAYAFTDYADSAFPIQLLGYTGQRLNDVTRSYPKLVAGDAKTLWRGYLRAAPKTGDVRGVLAGWAADEAMLGHAASARQKLLALARAGALNQGSGGAKGSSYVRALWKFLTKLGYVP